MNLDLRDRIRTEIIIRRLAVSSALERLKKEEKLAHSENRSVPRALMEKLQADIDFARDNASAAVCSLEAACCFPPLT